MFSRAIDFLHKHFVLTAILIGFFLLSSTGLFYNFGLATTVNDETPPLVAALKMIGDHTLRPAYPTFYYLPVAAYAELPAATLSLLALPLLGVATSVNAIREFVVLDFAKLLPFARFASVCYAILAIILFYNIALRFFERKQTALLAAFLFSTSFLLVQLAHFGRVWSVQTLMILIALWAILRIFDMPTLKRYLIVGGGVALSFGLNTIGALVYFPFVVAHFLRTKGRSISAILLERNFLLTHVLLFFCVSLFYYLNPYGFENYLAPIKKFFTMITGGVDNTSVVVSGGAVNPGFCGEGLFPVSTYYLRVLTSYEFFLLLFSSFGIFALWKRGTFGKRNEVIVFGTFLGVYFFGITALSIFGIVNCEQRYILPVIPILALLGALGVGALVENLSKHQKVATLFVIFALVLYGPVMYDLRLALPSTRLEAREWMLANIPDNARVINTDEKLDLPENGATLESIRTAAPERISIKRVYLILHQEKIETPSYFIYYPAFGKYSGGEDFGYLVISWWKPKDRIEQMESVASLGLSRDPMLIQRFPQNASDNTESFDLANNNVSLYRLWSIKQNGPTIDIYRLMR